MKSTQQETRAPCMGETWNLEVKPPNVWWWLGTWDEISLIWGQLGTRGEALPIYIWAAWDQWLPPPVILCSSHAYTCFKCLPVYKSVYNVLGEISFALAHLQIYSPYTRFTINN